MIYQRVTYGSDVERIKRKRNLLREMVRLQHNLNLSILNNWYRKIDFYKVYTAIHQEVSELIDTFEWKWWKKQKTDIEKRKLELVDVWHFILSYWLLTCRHSNEKVVDSATELIYSCLMSATPIKKEEALPKILQIDLYFHPNINNPTLATTTFLSIVLTPDVSGFNDYEDFVKYYFAKNILNMYRQERGYKTGRYVFELIKFEDNDALISILKEVNSFNNFEEFKEKIFKKLDNFGGWNGRMDKRKVQRKVSKQ